MNKEVTTFGDTEIDKRKLHHYKIIILIEDIDIDIYLTRFLLVKKVIKTLVITMMRIVKLFCFVYYAPKN